MAHVDRSNLDSDCSGRGGRNNKMQDDFESDNGEDLLMHGELDIREKKM